MIKRVVLTSLTALALAASAVVLADEAATIRAALAKVLPDFKPTSVKATPMEGLYEVEIGPQVMFVTGDGRYLIDGAIVDLETRENIAESAQSRARLRAIDQIGEDNMVTFEAASPEHTITVFTDIDCGYCRKLHGQIQAYNDAGISVHYLFYPRAGEKSESFEKAVSVWCADDRQDAMTRAKAGEKMPNRDCTNPVAQHMELGQLMGIRGTPAIVLDSGEMVPGYVEPKRLAGLLEQSTAAN
ncbi:MAG: DsbC family protein [Thiohalocapsa sp.]|jgi:thiol:disulfide interchange protein DsbC